MTVYGIDFGGVITDRIGNDGTDTSFDGDNFMKTTAIAGAFDAIKHIIERYGAKNVFIVSKCGPDTQRKTRSWLAGNGFYEHTGFNPENLRFCIDRAGKVPIVEGLGVTDFIDDKEEVLGYMKNIVNRRYLFGPQPTNPQDPTLIIVNNWSEVLSLLP